MTTNELIREVGKDMRELWCKMDYQGNIHWTLKIRGKRMPAGPNGVKAWIQKDQVFCGKTAEYVLQAYLFKRNHDVD